MGSEAVVDTGTGRAVAQRIRELRLARSLTLAGLASRLAELDHPYPLSTLSRIEQGKRRIDTNDLVNIARALDVSTDTLLHPPDEIPTGVSTHDEPVRRSITGPMHRSIVAVDVEGSTLRTSSVRGGLRRTLYDLLDRALSAAGIATEHLESLTDRGDGMLLLIRPHDEVPKHVLLNKLIPTLTALLAEYNADVAQPTLQLRLRAVVHAGEVINDGRGFYGEALDVAFRLLDAPPVKRTLKEAAESPLVLVVSEEIYSSIVMHGYVDSGAYSPGVRVKVAKRQRRGWVHIPVSTRSERSLRVPGRATPSSGIAPAGGQN